MRPHYTEGPCQAREEARMDSKGIYLYVYPVCLGARVATLLLLKGYGVVFAMRGVGRSGE